MSSYLSFSLILFIAIEMDLELEVSLCDPTCNPCEVRHEKADHLFFQRWFVQPIWKEQNEAFLVMAPKHGSFGLARGRMGHLDLRKIQQSFELKAN